MDLNRDLIVDLGKAIFYLLKGGLYHFGAHEIK